MTTTMIAALFVAVSAAAYDEKETRPSEGPRIEAAAFVSGAAAALSKADVAYAHSLVNSNLLRGDFGEAHMTRHLTEVLRRDGQWLPITARLGRTGLDGLHVRFDNSGRPSELILTEAKYGTSTLAVTKGDGIQLGVPWRERRLKLVAGIYRQIGRGSTNGQVDVQKVSVSPQNQRIQIPLRDGRAGVFWRKGPADTWKFAGPAQRLVEAGHRMRELGEYLQLCADGQRRYQACVFRILVRENNLSVTVKDANNLGPNGKERDLPVIGRLLIPLRGARLLAQKRLANDEIGKLLRNKLPHLSAQDAAIYADEIARSAKHLEGILSSNRRNAGGVMLSNSARAGAVAALVDGVVTGILEIRSEGRLRVDELGEHAALSFTAVSIGTYGGQQVTLFLMRSPVLQAFAQHSSLGLRHGSTMLLSRGAGAITAGTIATSIFSYGGYFLGWHDLQSANRSMIAGTTGSVVGTAAVGGATLLVMTYGAASTGTAIGTLGGAAATNATFAWFGGGSLAVGGTGMAGGAVVLTGGGIIVAAVVTAIVLKGFHLYDEHLDRKRLGLTMDRLARKADFSVNHIAFRLSSDAEQ